MSSKDYPAGVLRVWDNGGRSIDRYMVVFTPYLLDGQKVYFYLAMSASPSWGFAQHGELRRFPYKGSDKSILFAELPEACRLLVLYDLKQFLEITNG